MSTDKPITVGYMPTPEESAARSALYKNLQLMRELKDKPMPHFQAGPNGPRSFLAMLDDTEALLNIFTPSREEAGKADWQSNANVGGAEIRAKMRAIAAGVGLKVPDMVFEAVDGNGIRSSKRAEIFKHITKQTYSYGNPALNAFLETWHMLAHGLVIEYEGYKTGGAMQEVVESFNTLTGEVKTKKEYVKMDGRPFNVLINPQEFHWWSFFIRDIQDQPRLAWVQHYTKRDIELEFSKYPNYTFIKDKTEVSKHLQLQDSEFYKPWAERVKDTNDYEVIRMMSKEDDGSDGILKGYELWINGVPLLRCPLLWGDKEKVYPFIKQVPEHFANTNFFVGLPFPILMEGYADNKNMLLNSLVDKVARGLDPLKLVGLQNRDLLDVESEIHTADSTIYVPDINAVKFMDHPQVNQGELALLQMLNQGLELISIDRSQQGQTGGTQKTAREVVIADQRAQELKGSLYLSLEDLWYQKTKLRVSIILSHYLKDKAAADTTKGQIISIKDYTFGDGTRGILDIHVAKTKGKLLSQQEIESREQAMQQQGENYKLISMLISYLDDWQMDFKIISASLQKHDRTMKEDEVMGEIQTVVQLFPEFFVANKDKYLAEILELRGHHIDEYNPSAPPAPPMMGAPAQPGQPGQPSPNTPAQPSSVQPTAPNDHLAGLLQQLNQ